MSEFLDPDLYTSEITSIAGRRQAIDPGSDDGAMARRPWGLALSGGGIRSATFSLGVLQALARAPGVAASPLLARFDYLSTVSGGGYSGAFLSALFRDPEARGATLEVVPEVAPAAAAGCAAAAYRCMQQDPPGRMDESTSASEPDLPLRWLRENGRYMAPGGVGDMVYATALTIRSWCAIHYIFGITLLFAFFCMFCFRAGTVWLGEKVVFSYPFWPNPPLRIETMMQPGLLGQFWWSSWFLMVIVLAVLLVVPLGIAYWFTRKPSAASALRRLAGAPALWGLLLALGVLAVAGVATVPARTGGQPVMMLVLGVVAFMILAAIPTHLLSWWAAGRNVSTQRVLLTRALAICLGLNVAVALLGLVETAGQTLYLMLHQVKGSPVPTMSALLALLAALFPLLKKMAESIVSAKPGGMLERLPVDAILTLLALLILFAMAVLWHVLALTLLFQAADPWSRSTAASVAMIRAPYDIALLPYTLGLLGLSLAGTCAAGYFIGFVNLSSLATLYAARLTRAYLGASNAARFEPGPGAQQNKWRGVTEPHPLDDFNLELFHSARHLGPQHLINVTINRTSGTADQLTQKDRKGLPLAVTPNGLSVNGGPALQSGEKLSLGQWIGISGAAFSPGLGRGTSFGKAAVFTLTNIRLGYWWRAREARQGAGATENWLLSAGRQLTRNQRYLRRELNAEFYGQSGQYWYLSDGGHFENTGVYELLRRRCALIVACDAGADPAYSFEDLANLMRLARIDFGAEFEVLPPPDAVTELQKEGLQLGTGAAGRLASVLKDLDAERGRGKACAIAYRVSYKDCAETSLLLLIKPRLGEDAPMDLAEYQTRNATFPQESTFDQFFDEAQWESYRKLGAWTGGKLFC